VREDLLALTPDSVASLANLGLVKRALKEIEQGRGPSISEDDSGVVTGQFGDGAVARLVPGESLRTTPCSCGASSVCRHRVAVALAYRAWAEAHQPSRPLTVDAWSPGAVDDDALAARLGKRTMERASALRKSGVAVEVRRAGALEPTPSARLPTCTVRFLVARDLAYAQCDCTMRHDCEHVALAVWAFRLADARSPDAPQLTVDLAETRAVGSDHALDLSISLVMELLREGAAQAPPSLAQKLALVKQALDRAGYTWPLTIVEDLEGLLDAYRARSSRYAAGRFAELLAELAARARAASRPGALPAGVVLGLGEAPETKLDHLRLISLGARVEADGREREAEVLLADPDSATVLSLRKRWSFSDGEEPPDGPALASRRVASSVTLGALARGQVVTRVARRRANRSVVLGEGRGGMSSVTPQTGSFEVIPTPIRVSRLAELDRVVRMRAPRLLRPRLVAEDVHVIEVAAVGEVVWLPGAQRLVATVFDADGAPLRLAKPYRAVAPHATDHLAAALAGPVRFVSGRVHRRSGTFEMEPLAISSDRLIVPDLEPDGHRVDVMHGREPTSIDPVAAAVDAAWSALEGKAHNGLQHGGGEAFARITTQLADAGLSACSSAVAELERRLGGARADGNWDAAAVAWIEAGVRLLIARERL
jgi:hypothetical protein